VRLLAFLSHQGRQSVRAAIEIRGARRDDPLGTLDIADFVIDWRPVACLLWVIERTRSRGRGASGKDRANQLIDRG
jgi:hypothetical protein